MAGPDGGSEDGDEPAGGTAPGRGAIAYEREGWELERTVEEPDRIGVGDRVTFSKVIDDGDVREFAAASGDTNRLHLDAEFAGGTRFGGRIVHGTLVAGTISAALARLPGVTVYLSEEATFEGPVPVGERVTARVEVREALGDRRFRLSTAALVDGETVVDGEATVLIDDLPGEGP